MIVKYIGHAPKVTVGLPIDAPKSKYEKRITFLKGQHVELDEHEAKAILEADKQLVKAKDLTVEDQLKLRQNDPIIIDLKNGNYERHVNFIEGQKSDLKEEKEESLSSLEEKPKKKPGRPKSKK